MRAELLRVGRPVEAAQLLFCRLVALREGCSEASRQMSRLGGGAYLDSSLRLIWCPTLGPVVVKRPPPKNCTAF